MTLPGLLIEYLITGGLALIWLYPLLKRFELTAEINNSYLALYAIGLYFLGMTIDIIAWAATKPIKQIIRKRDREKYGFTDDNPSGSSHRRQAKFAIYAPEVAKESATRSSRDRIARGAIINSIMATIFVLPVFIGIVFIVISFVMWVAFERISYAYELSAEKEVDLKIENDRKKT